MKTTEETSFTNSFYTKLVKLSKKLVLYIGATVNLKLLEEDLVKILEYIFPSM